MNYSSEEEYNEAMGAEAEFEMEQEAARAEAEHDSQMQQDQPDLSVRNLSEYGSYELELIQVLIAEKQTEIIFMQSKSESIKKAKNSLDIWLYRLRDAIKESKERENKLNF